MSLDKHMQLTNEEKKYIDERFQKLIGKKDYAGALKFYEKLNNEAQKYIRTHDGHGWDLVIIKSHYTNHKR